MSSPNQDADVDPTSFVRLYISQPARFTSSTCCPSWSGGPSINFGSEFLNRGGFSQGPRRPAMCFDHVQRRGCLSAKHCTLRVKEGSQVRRVGGCLRHVVCPGPWRGKLDVIVAGHVLCGHCYAVSRVFGEEQGRGQPSNSGSELVLSSGALVTPCVKELDSPNHYYPSRGRLHNHCIVGAWNSAPDSGSIAAIAQSMSP